MMKKAVMQFMACCLAVGITFSSFGTIALADDYSSMTLVGLSETDTVVGLGGAQATGDTADAASEDVSDTASAASSDTAETVSTDTTVTATAETESSAADTPSADIVSVDTSSSDSSVMTDTAGTVETVAETEAEPVYDYSLSGQLAFAQCENYINVRAEASIDGEVVGKVYNNGSVTILGQLGDWYEVQSGNVSGYVKAEYFAIGEAAEEIAEAVAYNVATVNAEGLWIHTEASEDSATIGMAYSSDQLEVVAYEGDWMKVALGDGVYGYINAWYVDYDTYYSTAETLEEEQERLDAQWLAYLAEQEAEAAAAAAAAEAAAAEAAAAAESTYTESTDTYTESYAESYTSSSSSSSATSLSEAEAAVDEAYQNYLEAQEAADAATQQADEQLVYDTYDEAVAAYQEYLSAVAVADELKYSSTTTDTTSTESTYTESSSTESAYTETPQTEYTYTETEATYTETEATYTETEATYTETESTTTSTSSSSTLGQSIANYAVQFVGNPYVYGGTSLTNGADCSGFTQSVFASFGISIPRTAAAQASSGTSVSLSDIQPGDLLFYSDGSSISHVALYIGNGQVVHASTSSTGIIISSYNYRTPVCARRYWS